jgi:transcriptional regulator with XRE-family HTH domain
MCREIKARDALSMRTPEQTRGYLIRILRTKIGQTQKEFAKYLGISQAQLSRIEHGLRPPTPHVAWGIENILYPATNTVFPQPEVNPVLNPLNLH